MVTDRRLNVLQICHDYQGPFRTVCRQYTTAFAGHRITTVYLRGERRDDVAADTGGDRVIFLQERSLRGIKLGPLFRVAALFREEPFDVVIAHRYKPIYIAGVLSRFFSIPLLLGVVHEHGVFDRIGRSLFLRLWRPGIQFVAVSETVRRDILDSPASPEADRVFTLHHAIDTGKADRLLGRREAREAVGVPAECFCFGTVGRLVAKKAHRVLLEAWRLAKLAGDNRLVIVGSGPREAELKEFVSRNAMADSVIFTGRVEEAWKYLNAFDVFVLPSGDAEAFGIVLLEAMLAGLPIVASNAPGPGEVVADAGILFESGNAEALAGKMEMILDMPEEEIRALASRGHERLLANFSMAAFRERLWSLPPLQDVVGGGDR